MRPLVSVVMPVRNAGEFLQEAVGSILRQSWTRLELVLVNDHSTDGAVTALEQTDPRLRIIDSVEQGVVNAFNTGFRQCNGDFIARMDADDISLPERLTCQLDYLEQNPNIDIAGSCVEFFSGSGIKGGLERYQRWLNSLCDPADIHREIFVESPMPNPGTMFRRASLEQLGGYREVGWPEDYDLYLRADAKGLQMGKPTDVLLHWREHPRRLTHTDPLYGRKQFMSAKAHFLVHHRLQGRQVIIWGAGPTGRLMHDLIKAEGGHVEGFLEVHPRRIGGQKRGLPVWSIEKMAESGLPMVLVAVGAAGAREEITAFMLKHEKVAGQDYLFVA